MPVTLYQFALAAVFVLGIAVMMEPLRQTRGYLHTLRDLEQAGIDYIGAHCQALPDSVTDAQLQASEHLSAGFDNQGTRFTWQLADHPAVRVNAGGNRAYLAFLARHTLGEFATDGSYYFVPGLDVTFFRAANHAYNLFAYDEYDFSCAAP